MNSKKYDIVVYIGRFQPPHRGHLETIRKATTLANRVVVLVGSAWKPRDSRNPFNWVERASMISKSLGDLADKIRFYPIRDHLYSDAEWTIEVQSKVAEFVSDFTDKPRIGIIGMNKDHTSYYLKMFPQWESVNADEVFGVDSTWIRDSYFNDEKSWTEVGRSVASRNTSKEVIEFLDRFMVENRPEWERISKEQEHVRLYKNAWKSAPYPPTFITADAVVIQSGHVLMVKRGAMPGEGLWALPGGFVNQFESVEDACIRELREETKLKVPDPVLRGSIMAEKRFDHPMRSLRGRTITTAFFIKLQDGELPKVKGSDDAKHAMWIPLATFEKMEEVIFEDHYHIVKYFI